MRRAALLLLISIGGFGQVTGLTDLHSLRGRSRPLLIFAPKPNDPRLETQLRTPREHEAEVSDRDIVAIALLYNGPSPTEAQLPSTEAVAARRRFHIHPQEFAVILIGKDGGEKMHATEPLPMGTLNQTIDAMPMRKDELRAKQGR